MGYPYMFLALVIGLLLPAQVGINAELARRVSSPVTAGLISFAVGTVVLLICGWACGLPCRPGAR